MNRNSLDYDGIDHFRKDLMAVSVIEEDVNGELYCNCYSKRLPSGVKGEICSHKVALLLKKGILEKPLNTSIANKKRGRPGRVELNKKQRK